MIIAHSLAEIPQRATSVVTVGTFDGVHLGHSQIAHRLRERAQAKNVRSVLVTFDPHPREVVGRGPVKLLSTVNERIALLEQLEIQVLLIVHFTFEFSRQSSQEFYEQYVVRGIGVEEVIVGYDHMFGRDREAGVEELKIMGEQLGFTVYREPPFTLDGEIISSSKIREMLLRGDVQKAASWLGRSYSLIGQIIRGDGRGASLGFPTANIQLHDDRKLIPAEGVYFVEIELEGRNYFGMLSIGINPTFKIDGTRTIEVHIFDFHEILYGKTLSIHFLRRLRGEKKFTTPEELVKQLRRDQEQCMKFIESHEQIR